MTGAIRLVLDTSAILAYARTSIAVGETIAEVVDEGGRFAIPAVCLAEASRLADDDQTPRLLLLSQHVCAVVTTTPDDEWRVLVEWTRILGRVDLAAAMAHTTYVLTAEPKAYGDDVDQLPVIPI
ncbi:hypothetical protein [Micromonospora sp. NBC_01796]|uniref:hypothetical protein n=1 Tax=Micromonospora sp. NBC_01796 TaxID=2975987 RepID=UPI002DDA46A5|nr:hypothetical protein [Micromonospora sp. NBC_01796]WSA86347.1 hypothetical protein OIE47_01630 [Micromonospora sp. NBC_01796]